MTSIDVQMYNWACYSQSSSWEINWSIYEIIQVWYIFLFWHHLWFLNNWSLPDDHAHPDGLYSSVLGFLRRIAKREREKHKKRTSVWEIFVIVMHYNDPLPLSSPKKKIVFPLKSNPYIWIKVIIIRKLCFLGKEKSFFHHWVFYKM